MDDTQVADDRTVAEAAPAFPDPVEHVRGVLENLYNGKREHGAAMQVRVGLPTKGVRPRYRVEEAGHDGHDGAARIHGVFDGKNHKPVAQDPEELESGSWSSRTMSLQEVASLLGELRGVKAQVTPPAAPAAKKKKKK